MGKIAIAGPALDIKRCPTRDVIIKNGGQIVENSDGSVSVFNNNPKTGLYPVSLNLYCCKLLKDGYYFDINTQTCRWSEPKTCGFGEPINLIVNPKGNDGSLFYVDLSDNENCSLKISFDYLLKVKCEDLSSLSNPSSNTLSQETLNQIHDVQLHIQEINVKIESISTQAYNLNQQYLITPYSIECNHFPVITTTPDPINCMVSAWGPWSTCVNGFQTHTRTVTTQPAYGGIACPPLSETQACTVGPCVPPANMSIRYFGFSHSGVDFTSTQTTACAAAQFGTDNQTAWHPFYVTNFAVGGLVYVFNTTCQRPPDGWYNTNLGTKEITHIVNGVILSITNCATTPPPAALCFSYSIYTINPTTITWTDCAGVQQSIFLNASTYYIIPCARENSVIAFNSGITKLQQCYNTAKLAAFDNSGFNPKSLDVTTAVDTAIIDASVFQKGSVTTYTSVDYCLTDLGLQAWQTILGPVRYQQFILGDPTSYTCADVIAISQLPNAAELFYTCDVKFGTKSELLVQINELMTELTYLNSLLTEQQNILIDLEDNFTNIQNGNEKCETPIQALESMDIEMHLDIVGPNDTLVSVSGFTFFPSIGTGNLYNYLSTHANSGFYVCGDPTKGDDGLSDCTTLSLNNNGEQTPNVFSCNSLIEDMLNQLFTESGLSDVDSFNQMISTNALASQWLTYSMVITDPAIIAAITNQKIKISFRIKYSCVDFCLLLDNLVLDKTCTHVDKTEIIIPESPGFEFQRVIDNKKSWIDTTVPTNRQFHIAKFDETNSIRQTDYNVNDERLVLNSKEIDLDISVASAIETDVWCYLNDNPNLLTGYTSTSCTSCQVYEVNLENLVTQSISGITTIEGFENFMVSEFIDAKNRQTITSYATLRAIYERYLNSSYYVGNTSSAFTYESMDKFAGLVGNYWIDLIEQVVPSTAIWGSVKIYTNTIFDEQKFKYKSYSTLLCDNPFQGEHVLSPINGVSGETAYPNVIYQNLIGHRVNSPTTRYANPNMVRSCDAIHIAQMNAGSEFIGNIEITPKIKIGCDPNNININECDLGVRIRNAIKENTTTLSAVIVGGTGPFTYLWSNGATTESINVTNSGNYSVVVTDTTTCCTATAQFEILNQKACWFTMPEKPEYIMGSFYQDLYGACGLNDYPLKEVIFNVWDITINGVDLTLPAPPLSTTMTPDNINWVSATNNIVYRCTPGQVTGQTYTNYVDFLNSVFNTLGLNGYKAQVSLKQQKVGDNHYNEHNGFYIIYPSTDSFSIKTESVHNVDKYIYSNTGISEWDPLYNGYNSWSIYGKSFCDGITVTNGKVIE